MSSFASLLKHKRVLSFGFSMTTFSSFGQTFLVSLFLPSLLKEFQLTNASFGELYALATLLSALTLPYFGKKIDSMSVKRYTMYVGLGLVVSCFLFSLSESLVFLFLAFLGLRLTGQGLMGHIAATSMARYFNHLRGKALSIAWLGYPFGEAVLPILVTLMISAYGWRVSWIVMGIFILLTLIPLLLFFDVTRALDQQEKTKESIEEWKESVPSVTRKEVLRDYRFYLMLPVSFLPPLTLTCLFLYQLQIAELKGWTAEWAALSFTAFAIARFVFSLVAGLLVDRFTAMRLFPIHLIPLVIGVGILMNSSHPYASLFYLAFAGMTVGLGGNIKSSMLPEIYGPQHLGSIRSVIVMVSVLSTSAGPVAFGHLLDAGIQLENILFWWVIFAGFSVFLSFIAFAKYRGVLRPAPLATR
jgi:MFS family permease